jgi:trans-aconitate methyltransferase
MSAGPREFTNAAPQGYSGRRPDVLRLIDRVPARCLDVGCGAGWLGSELKKRDAATRVEGIESDSILRASAQGSYDAVHELDLADTNAIAALRGDYDLIVCADVLEHLAAPEATLHSLVAKLARDGRLITSIPNVRHYSTLVALLFTGRWPRRLRGIHDRTHLRFFTRDDMLDLFAGAGLIAVRETRNLRLVESWSWTTPVAKLLDFWPFRPFLTFQYLHVLARRVDA